VLGDQKGAPLCDGARRTCRPASPQVVDRVEQGLALGRGRLVATLRLTTSADSRLAAISKVVRVRVEFSKNRLNTALAAQQRHLLDLALGRPP
jgi:hypothetical protein